MNVSATPFDLTTGNFPYPAGSASIFGPPTPAAAGDSHSANGITGASGGSANNNNQDNALFDTDWNNPGTEMWYLPPGAAFFQNMDSSSVAMTAEGLHVGGMDLLDYMAMDPSDPQQYGVLDVQGF